MSTDNQILHPYSALPEVPLARRPARWWRIGRTKARKTPQKIVLFGLFGCGNLGNDGSLEAVVGFLRQSRPEAQLHCICDNPDLVARTFDLEARPISWSRHLRGLPRKLDKFFLKIPGKLFDVAQTFRFIRKTDVMIIPGTGILDDFGERPYGMPLDIFRWCLAARIAGTKIAFVSIGAGPIGHSLSRWLMTSAARLAHYRSYRDTLSKEFMESVSLDTSQDFIYPDIVFKLRTPPALAPNSDDPDHLTVGVGVMSYYGWYGFAQGGQAIFSNYIEKLAQFVVHLLDHGHNVRLLTGELTDQIAVDALLKKAGEARPDVPTSRIVAEPSFSLHDLMHQISATDVVVATRFHNIVCALKMGKPTVSLGYSKKNDALMAEMGLQAYCQHVEQFKVDALIDQFSCLAVLRENYGRMIRTRTQIFKEQLDRQDAHLLSILM